MGFSFRAPRKADSKQWKKVQLLHEGGFWFYSSMNLTIPDLPSQVGKFLDEWQKHPQGKRKRATPSEMRRRRLCQPENTVDQKRI